MAHEHTVIDNDSRFVIDKATRQISTSSGYATIMQYDHNSEKLTFEIPKLIDGHDMTKCNEVEVHYINIDASTKESNVGVYAVDDLQVDPENADKAILSWLISNNATQYAGVLNFLIKFKCVVDGKVEYAWNTARYTALTVSDGIENGEMVVEEYADILAQWESRIEAVEQNAGASSWNDLEDKPFGVIGEGDKLEWDGNKNTPKTLMDDGNGVGFSCYKVSDTIITQEDLANGFKVAGYHGDMGYAEVNTPDLLVVKEDGSFLIPVPDENGNIYTPMFIWCIPDGAQYEAGIYFGEGYDVSAGAEYRVTSLTIPGFGKFKITKSIEPEFLPAYLFAGETRSLTNTLVWDGNGDGLEPEDLYSYGFYKISDVVVTSEDLANGFYLEYPLSAAAGTMQTDFLNTNDITTGVQVQVFANGDDVSIGYMDENGNAVDFVRFTQSGIWVTVWTDYSTNWETLEPEPYTVFMHTLTIPGFDRFPATVNKTINKKYLPKAAPVMNSYGDSVSSSEFNELLRVLREAGYLAI